MGTKEMVGVDYGKILQDVRVAQEILINDGKISLKILRIGRDRIHTTVAHGGVLRAHQGLNLPETDLSIPSLTEKDEKDLIFGLEAGVDWVALSFIRSAADVVALRP